jgi:predicted lipoprotein with Yx(FWY)xxD motif
VKKLSTLLVTAAAMVALGACGEPGSSSAPQAAAPQPSAAAAPAGSTEALAPRPSPTARPEAILLDVRPTTVKGVDARIVTVNGMTAYRFEADEDKPSKVNCLYDCLVTWPPALTDGSTIRVAGIEPGLVGVVTRADGLKQVTLNGWPLYKFKEDTAPGDIKGEGLGGNWSTVKPDGKPVIKKNPATAR